MREHMDRQRIELRWIDTRVMCADPLTKEFEDHEPLRTLAQHNHLVLVYVPETLGQVEARRNDLRAVGSTPCPLTNFPLETSFRIVRSKVSRGFFWLQGMSAARGGTSMRGPPAVLGPR